MEENYHLIISSPHHKIDVSELQAGIYFIKVFDIEGNSVVKRVAVVR
jgi:hypothetical protein